MMAEKLRIAFIDYILEPDKPGRSGLSDLVWDMAVRLVEQGHEAHVIASYHTSQYPDSRVMVHNFPTPPIGYRNLLGQLWILKRAADIARRLQPDVIHAPEYLSTAVLGTLGVPAPLVLTVPGNVFHRIRYGHSYEWYYLQVLKWAARASAKRCAAVIAVSREMKRWWEWTGSAPAKTHWIPLGVDPNRFHPVPGARARLGIREDCVLLLYVGRFAEEKGLMDLLNALVVSRQVIDLTKAQVMLIGKGPQQDELRRTVRDHKLDGTVQIVPWVRQEDLPAYYSAADAVLLPSHTEAFARVIPEALSCGTPVIGSMITGTEDHVHNGVTGYLFPAGDVRALADVLVRVIDHPQAVRSLREPTLVYVQRHLTWQRIMERVVNEVYRPLAARGTAIASQTVSATNL